MGFFSDIGGALISGVSNIIGGREARKGVERAAVINEEAIREGEGRSLESLDRGRGAALGDLDTGLDRALGFVRPLVDQGQAGTRVLLREAVADPGMLTPFQRKALEDAQRGARNQLATTGLRGAGRTQSRILQEVTDDFVNRAIEDNRTRRNTAADRLFGAGVTGATGAANASLATGGNRANVESGTAAREASEIGANARGIGGVGAEAAATAGDIRGNTVTSTGRLVGDTLGTIATEIADERKRRTTTGQVATGV